LQASLANLLHKQEFALLLIDDPLDIMGTHLCSCAGLGVGAWLLTHPTTPAFRLSLAHFLTDVPILACQNLRFAHLSQCQYDHTIDDLCTHLFQCLYESDRIIAHGTIRNTIRAIILESETHVQREVSHLFPHLMRSGYPYHQR
jgi:hypothetical protein